jgi:hypothetical protein
MDFINLIYGGDKQKIKQNTLFSNCSHSKGIKHIRENLKEYSRSNVRSDDNVYFKTIILYNFDNLSVDGQSALRRVIEAYSQSTRFFLILQNKQRILQPILSRFSHIFVPLPLVEAAPENLHQHELRRIFGGVAPARRAELLEILGASAAGGVTEVAEMLYERGFSCWDIIETLPTIITDPVQQSKIIMCFHTIKSEYRNEKLLMLYILLECNIANK